MFKLIIKIYWSKIIIKNFLMKLNTRLTDQFYQTKNKDFDVEMYFDSANGGHYLDFR